MKNRLMKLYSAFLVLLFALPGCSSWLDLKPEDKVTDEQLFSTITGFRSSLNGIYIDLNSSNLYGGTMLFNAIEIMAQRYDLTGAGAASEMMSIGTYDYTSDNCKKLFESTWERYYFLIGNCNKIIEYGHKNAHILTGENKGLILGEAYALRAYLHFDLLRLFGPIYSTNKKDLAIPYYSRFQLSGADIISAEKVIENVIQDLTTAKDLLKNDPIIEKGPQRFETNDGLNVETFRTERLNYYAITALMARVWLYAGDNTKALEAAREVTAVQEKWFPFVQRKQIVGNSSNPDRVFHTELLFSTKNTKRGDIFTNYFSSENKNFILSSRANIEDIYTGTADRDWRFSNFWKVPDTQVVQYRCFHKYETIETADYWKEVVPLIRMSEMYYIIAETTTDAGEALNVLNKIYVNRGLNSVTEIADLKNAIKDEYVKEFFGEGQLFFYYKRVNEPKIRSLVNGKDITMSKAQYVVPLPKSETDFRD